MTKIFVASKLAEIVDPYDLTDVLDSLVDNGFVESYEWDYTTDEMSITISKGIEVQDLIDEMQDITTDGRKKRTLQ